MVGCERAGWSRTRGRHEARPGGGHGARFATGQDNASDGAPVIPARELVSAEALRRYDDNGEPMYSTYERVLLCLRWFDWCSAERMYDALDVEDYETRQLYDKALRYWIKRGRVARNGDAYKLLRPAQWGEATECARCPAPRVEDKTMCQRHLDWEREYKQRKRAGVTPAQGRAA